MTMRLRLLGLMGGFLLQCAGPAQVHAAEFAAGGLVFHERLDIVLERQDIAISPDAVRITYVFRSHAAAPQQATLAFPMPPVPVAGGTEFLGGGEINEEQPANYMYFSAKADGRPVEANSYGYAYLGETDIGEVLRAADLPLLISPEAASDMIAALPAEQFFALEERGIVMRGGDDPPHFTPQWSYQTVFEWQQSFPPGRTVVAIDYRPLVGVIDDPGLAFESGPEAAKFCIDDDMRAEIASRKASGQNYEVRTLGYLLAVAQDWKGPIGTFNLVVNAGDDAEAAASLVAVCLPGAKRISANRYAWTAGDYVPTHDLAIAFFYFRQSP